jgi:hypothetical protein
VATAPVICHRRAQVVFNGARADKQLGGDVPIGQPARRKPRDLRLLGRELVQCVDGPLTGTLACRQQLTFGAPRERLDAHAGERLQRNAQMLSRVKPATFAA